VPLLLLLLLPPLQLLLLPLLPLLLLLLLLLLQLLATCCWAGLRARRRAAPAGRASLGRAGGPREPLAPWLCGWCGGWRFGRDVRAKSAIEERSHAALALEGRGRRGGARARWRGGMRRLLAEAAAGGSSGAFALALCYRESGRAPRGGARGALS
jgi:hypothetical protein